MAGLQSTSRSASAAKDSKETIARKVDVCTFYVGKCIPLNQSLQYGCDRTPVCDYCCGFVQMQLSATQPVSMDSVWPITNATAQKDTLETHAT